MNTPRTHRVTVTVLLAAGGLFLLPAPAYAGCMTDEKGNQVCGDSGTGPDSGPGSYNGVSGVNNGNAGDIGPDGRPMTGATQPVFGPGTAPLPTSAAPNSGGPANYVAPPPAAPQTNEQLNGPGYQPSAQDVPGAPANTGAQVAAEDAAASTVEESASATATAAPTVSAAPSSTMTARPTRPATQTKSAPAEAIAAEPSAEAEPFNPVPLIFIVGGTLLAAALVWFVRPIRAAVARGVGRKNSH